MRPATADNVIDLVAFLNRCITLVRTGTSHHWTFVTTAVRKSHWFVQRDADTVRAKVG